MTVFKEDKKALIPILEDIPSSAYDHDEGIGWAYRSWQEKAKEELN